MDAVLLGHSVYWVAGFKSIFSFKVNNCVT